MSPMPGHNVKKWCHPRNQVHNTKCCLRRTKPWPLATRARNLLQFGCLTASFSHTVLNIIHPQSFTTSTIAFRTKTNFLEMELLQLHHTTVLSLPNKNATPTLSLCLYETSVTSVLGSNSSPQTYADCMLNRCWCHYACVVRLPQSLDRYDKWVDTRKCPMLTTTDADSITVMLTRVSNVAETAHQSKSC